MFQNAVEVESVETMEPEKLPHHFDLVGLAQGLHKTASVASHISKLRQHVQDAEKALSTHVGHVEDIKNLLAKAEGDQKFQLAEVLKSAEKHVDELKKTVDKAHKHLNEQMEKLDKDDREEVEKQAKEEKIEQDKKDKKEKESKKDESKEEKHSDNAEIQTTETASTMTKSLLELHQQLFSKIKKAKMMHKSIVKVEKLIKKHKHEFTLANDDTEKMKQKKEVHSLEIRKVKKDDLLLKLEEEIKDLEKKNLTMEKKAKEEAAKKEHESEEESSEEEEEDSEKPKEKKAKKEKKDKAAVKKEKKEEPKVLAQAENKEAIELKAKLTEAEASLAKAKSEVEKQKSLTEASEKKVADLEKQQEKQSGELKKETEELEKTKKEYESLKSKHDTEVKELFENKDTLKFVKQMKFYKKEWANKSGDEDRKKIATSMASSTKNWVSSPSDNSAITDDE